MIIVVIMIIAVSVAVLPLRFGTTAQQPERTVTILRSEVETFQQSVTLSFATLKSEK